jgi:selenocysteine lyase/cysteine desulfurase
MWRAIGAVCRFAALHEHEIRLRTRIEEGLASFGDEVVLRSRAQRRTPTLLITMPGRRTADASAFLAARDVLAPSGSFYGYEPFHALGVDDVGALRVGLAPYNDDRDVDRLLEGLAEFLGS